MKKKGKVFHTFFATTTTTTHNFFFIRIHKKRINFLYILVSFRCVSASRFVIIALCVYVKKCPLFPCQLPALNCCVYPNLVRNTGTKKIETTMINVSVPQVFHWFEWQPRKSYKLFSILLFLISIFYWIFYFLLLQQL